MNAVESSISFLLEFSTIFGVDRSEWNSETWSLIIQLIDLYWLHARTGKPWTSIAGGGPRFRAQHFEEMRQ